MDHVEVFFISCFGVRITSKDLEMFRCQPQESFAFSARQETEEREMLEEGLGLPPESELWLVKR